MPTDAPSVAHTGAQLLPYMMTDDVHGAMVVRLVSAALGATTLGVEAAAVASVEVASNATRRPLRPDMDDHRGSFAYVGGPRHLVLFPHSRASWGNAMTTCIRAIRQLLELTATDALRP